LYISSIRFIVYYTDPQQFRNFESANLPPVFIVPIYMYWDRFNHYWH
jgi:hypothetical protein